MIHANMLYSYEVARSGFVFLWIDGDMYIIIGFVLCEGPSNEEERKRNMEHLMDCQQYYLNNRNNDTVIADKLKL